MDTLKKFLNLNRDESMDQPLKRPTFGNEFRKPIWFDDCESDDELSERKAFQVFTNPMEMEKYFEQRMQEILKSVEIYEGGKIIIDENIRENFLKPGFEDFEKDFFEPKKAVDTDLDDEIYADQLHSLLQRISPENHSPFLTMKPYVEPNKSIKKTDEETIWDRIHGTFVNEDKPNPPKRNQQLLKKLPHARGGVFEGALQGPKLFRQSVITQVVRKPDGSSETRRTVRDVDGNENITVVTRTSDGKVETFNYPGNGQIEKSSIKENRISSVLPCDRNVFVTKEGYAIPKLW